MLTGARQPPVAKPVPSSSPRELLLSTCTEGKRPRYLPRAGGAPWQGIAPGFHSNICYGLTTLPLLIARCN